MEIPLITLLDKLDKRFIGYEKVKQLPISGIRLLTEEPLQGGILYIGKQPPTNDIAYSQEAVAIFCCDPVETPYAALFAGPKYDYIQLANEFFRVYEQFVSYSERAHAIVYQKRNIEELILLCSEIMGNPAYLVDSSFKVLAIDKTPMYSELSSIWKNLVEYGYLSFDIVSNLRKSDELTLMESYKQAVLFESNYFNNTFINYNLRYNGKIAGHFFVVGYNKKILEGEVVYANFLGKLVLSAMENDLNYTRSRGNDYENFFIHMLDGTLKDKAQIECQLEPLGWNIEDRYLLCRLLLSEDELIMETICSRLENINSGKPLMFEEGIVAIFPLENENSADAIEIAMARMLQKYGGRGGFSDVFDGFYRIHMHYQQACTALTLSQNDHKCIVHYRDYAFSHLLNVVQGNMDLDMLCEKIVFRLHEYDQKHSTDYLKTLEAYIRNERSIVQTSKDLSIHRNTLLYRIKKLNEFPVDLDDPAVRIRLILSFEIMKQLDY